MGVFEREESANYWGGWGTSQIRVKARHLAVLCLPQPIPQHDKHRLGMQQN